MTNDTTTPGAGEELKPCPFCASTNVDPEGWASHNPATGESKVGPACDDCGGSAFTVDLWNSRPIPRAAASVTTASGNEEVAAKVEGDA